MPPMVGDPYYEKDRQMHEMRFVGYHTDSRTDGRIWFRQQYPCGENNFLERPGYPVCLRQMWVLGGMGGIDFRS
jgi:hypothetical protein